MTLRRQTATRPAHRSGSPQGSRCILAIGCALSTVALAGCLGGTDTHGTGSLLVNTPQVAQVEIDGAPRGATNAPISEIAEGSHVLTVVADGSVIYEATVDVSSDATAVVDTASDMSADESLADADQNALADSEVTDGSEFMTDDSGSATPDSRAVAATTAAVTADFAARDNLPQTHVPRSRWRSYGSWGPPSADYPASKLPGADTVAWKRDRVVAVAKRYIGMKYKHVHIPAMGGLDCSNFTAWVYNYGLGLKLTSAVADQARQVGRTVSKQSLLPGDLVYFRSGGQIIHTGMYLGAGLMIDDSTMNGGGGKVATKKLNAGWPASHYACAKRVIW